MTDTPSPEKVNRSISNDHAGPLSELQKALNWAGRGHLVHPVKWGEAWPEKDWKKPLTEWSTESTTIKQQIVAWAEQWPTCKFAWAIDPDHCAADLDLHVDPDALINHPWPDNWHQDTPHGGIHYIFKGSLPVKVKPLPGIDTRGCGGYVVIYADEPPGFLSDYPYPAVPGFLTEATQSRDRTTRTDELRDRDLPDNIIRATNYLRSRQRLEGFAVRRGGRDDYIYKTATWVRSHFALTPVKCLELIEQHLAADIEGWGHDFTTEDLKPPIAHAFEYAQDDFGAWARPDFAETFKHVNADAIEPSPEASIKNADNASRFKAHKRGEYRDRPPARNLIDALHLPEEGVALLAGDPGSFKSFIALGIAASVATGRPAFGNMPVNMTGIANYAAGEGVRSIEDKRIPAYEKHTGLDLDQFPFFTVRALPTAANMSQCAEFQVEIDAAIASAGKPHRITVLDTLARLMPGMNENDVGDTGLALAVGGRIVERHGGLTLVLHHFNKEGGLRGSTGIEATVDWWATVDAIKDPTKGVWLVKLTLNKTKDGGGEGSSVYFRGNQILLGEGVDNSSLTFDQITEAEYKGGRPAAQLDMYDPRSIGGILIGLNAYGRERAVSTHVLAAQMRPRQDKETVEAHEKALHAVKAKLSRLVSDKLTPIGDPRSLACYAEKGAGPANSTIWYLPAEHAPEGTLLGPEHLGQ